MIDRVPKCRKEHDHLLIPAIWTKLGIGMRAAAFKGGDNDRAKLKSIVLMLEEFQSTDDSEFFREQSCNESKQKSGTFGG
jgi:hypothetical protein